MFHLIKTHARQLVLYLLTGCTGAVVEFGSYLLMLRNGMWYITASAIAFVFAYITVFLMHKYIVFKRPESFLKHLWRHASVEGLNLVLSTILLYIMVEKMHFSEEWAKFLTMGLAAAWNFLLYKFLVFV